MKVMNEALRMFLAITALILTAMLTSPGSDHHLVERAQMAAQERERQKAADALIKKIERKTASQKKVSIASRGRRS